MGWRCLLGHKWKIKTSRNIHTFGEKNHDMPIACESWFLMQCQDCGYLQERFFNAPFAKNDDDDDDRDDDREKPILPKPDGAKPEMTPDEYYSMITKD